MYKVQPFIWKRFSENEAVFQTQNSTVVITNKNMIEFLIEVESQGKTQLDVRDIEKHFCEKSDDVISFLENNQILKREIKKELSINNLYMLSTDTKLANMIGFYLEEDFSVGQISENELIGKDFDENDCLIVFMNPFSISKLEEYTNIAQNKNVIIKVIFTYNNKIYFSNFYKKKWYNPCPMCFFGALESQLRGEINDVSINFQTLIDILYAKQGMFEIEVPLTKSAYFHILYLLMQYLLPILSEHKVDEVLELDLSNFTVNKDIAYHWGYCDCYE